MLTCKRSPLRLDPLTGCPLAVGMSCSTNGECAMLLPMTDGELFAEQIKRTQLLRLWRDALALVEDKEPCEREERFAVAEESHMSA